MRKIFIVLGACGLVMSPLAALAQDDGGSEIIISGMRRLNPDRDDENRARLLAIPSPAAVQMLLFEAGSNMPQSLAHGL